MKMFLKLASVATLALSLSAAHASNITYAGVYQNVPSPGNAAAPGNFAGGLANGTFTVGAAGIAFNSNGSVGQNTIADFLNHPTFIGSFNGFDPNGTAQNIELYITGFLTLNAGLNSLVVGHDDGTVLNIAGFGNVVNAPGPTGFSASPFTINNTGAAGDYAFTLEYVECCGFPANLDFTLNNASVTPVPEPGSIALLGTGALAFAGAVRRRFLKA